MRFRYVRTEPADPRWRSRRGWRAGRCGPAAAAAAARPRARRSICRSRSRCPRTASGRRKPASTSSRTAQLKELVYEDASFSTPLKAANADTFLFTRQTFVEFPDLRVSGPDFKDAKKITDANPQQAEYLWGHRILFDFKNKDGHRLQGILAIPDDYKPGEKRPMLVNFYEKNSQNLHRYNAPSYLTGMGSSPMQAVSEGYITMLPDVHFHTGSSHSDMLDCGRSRGAQGDRDGLRRSEAHRHQRPQLRRRRRGVHRHAVAAVRRRRHGRGRHRSLLGLQPELGLVVPGHRRQRRTTATTTTCTGRDAGASRRGTSRRSITSSRRSRTCPR